MKSTYRRMLSLILCFTICIQGLVFLSGCKSEKSVKEAKNETFESKGETVNLMDGISKSEDFEVPGPTCGNYVWECTGNQLNFGLELLKRTEPGENVLISPLSIITALAMVMNGADGETRSQFESVYGMSVETLNEFLYYYENEENADADENSNISSVINSANSIWIKNDPALKVDSDFLQANVNYFSASVFKSPFDDGTIADINKWVSDNTNGMIPGMVDDLDGNRVMLLINALSFESDWQEKYEDTQVGKNIFINENGKSKKTDFMYSTETYYLQNKEKGLEGFMKPYADGRYAFAAILPKAGTSIENFLNNISGWDLQSMILNSGDHSTGLAVPAVRVHAAIPKFKSEYSVGLSEVLSDMGMKNAFLPGKADFSKLGTYDGKEDNLYIGEVLHKTFIEVAEQGTRAGAATSVDVDASSAIIDLEIKEIILDRPFFYMIVDMFSGTPVFMGTVCDV